MYYLMNKNIRTASIIEKDGRWELLHQDTVLPIGKFEINGWLEDRKAFKHNHHLKRLMIDCGCETTEGFIRITHAASINDCYWIRTRLIWNTIEQHVTGTDNRRFFP